MILFRREQNNIKREDFLNSLLQMKAKSELSFNEVAAQMFIFQLAGYETSSTTLTYVAYELAMNMDIQERVREEIKSIVELHNDLVTYEAVFEMPYLECVINEALRKYPPALFMVRRVTVGKYRIPDTNVELSLNDLIAIPIYGIHHDPLIYPNPEEFNPDRFSAEEIKKRHSMSFLAFGGGNRNCIGMRFAMMEIKIALAKILLKFRLERGEDLPEKLSFRKQGIILSPDCDINIYFREL